MVNYAYGPSTQIHPSMIVGGFKTQEINFWGIVEFYIIDICYFYKLSKCWGILWSIAKMTAREADHGNQRIFGC